MVYNLSETQSIVGVWMRELRDITTQKDRFKFRKNLERLGEIIAYEISKDLEYQSIEIQTPLGTSTCEVLKSQPILATILRAGLPLHQGVLNIFDQADCAFIASYRKHRKDGTFTIQQEYMTCPPVKGRTLIISDPMLATGASLALSIKELMKTGTPASIHLVCTIACTQGVEYIRKQFPQVNIWAGAIDDEITAKGYIVPGLGDAGDLCFGSKEQA